MRLLLGALLLPLALGGCADMTPFIQALAGSPNAACIKVSSIWFSTSYDHNWGCEMPPAGRPVP